MRSLNNTFLIDYFKEKIKGTIEWETLQDKTQVFNDRVDRKVKSRGAHCDDVADISSRLCELLDGDAITCKKAELIGLIHDLGHIPFGHAGEAVADSIISEHEFTEQEKADINQIRSLMFGSEYASKNSSPCFEHNENSVIQYITMCKRFGFEIDEEVITGILSHSTSRYPNLPQSLSQQAVRLADKLAYINFDVDDLFLTFSDKEEEKNALEEMYKKPLLDPNGNEIKIALGNGKEYTLYEFLKELGTDERIELFIEAAVLDAKNQAMRKEGEYANYETVLTGCNDLVVRMSKVRKNIKKAKTDEEKQTLETELEQLNRELYQRSPILYAAYEIKNRSDDFIRTGVGLTHNSQVDRTKNSLSAVGNKDLMNEYIYKSLVTYLKQQVTENKNLSEEQVRSKYQSLNYPQEYIDLFFNYIAFKKEQDDVILSLPQNNGKTFPEIYTIVNFIGVHSNTELTHLAKKGGIDYRFGVEVLPQIQELINNPELYDAEKGVFTKAGMKARTDIVKKYGAEIQLEFGLEQECILPTASDEVIERAIQSGYLVPDYQEKNKVDNAKKFREVATLEEQKQLQSMYQTKGITEESIGIKI